MGNPYKTLIRTEKIKGTLDLLAYASLALDIMIAVVTLISLRAYSTNLDEIIRFLNIVLTIEVAIAAFVFVLFVLNLHYEKIIEHLLRLRGAVRRPERKRQGH